MTSHANFQRSRLGLLLLLTGVAGCGGSTDDPAGAGAGSGGAPAGHGGLPTPNPCGEPDASLGKRNAAELFGADHVPAFDLYLPSESWDDLKAHAVDEEYVPAHACYDGAAIGEVGLRFKGAYGSLRLCFDASGKNTCRKLGMKLKFDKYAPDQRFFGLKRLNFQGNRYDDSYLKERLAYDLYRDMDVTAPRATWAVLRVNGEPQGLFGMVEEVDGRFTKDRWPDDGDGNLYKEVWPGRTSEVSVVDHLKTNEDEADISGMLAFSDAIASAPEERLRSTLGAHTDLDQLARYMAVDDAIANFDGITTYYTSGSADEAGNHNFYLYEKTPGNFVLIPWDLESTLSLASNFGNVPSWQIIPEDCAQTYPVWGGDGRVIAPGCDRVFRALNADLESYRAATERLLEGPMAEAPLLAKIDELASFVRTEAEADPHGPGAAKFDGAVKFLKQEIPKLRRRLQHLASGEPSIPLVIDVEGVTDFEAVDDYGLTDGTTQLSNPNSDASVEVNRSDPIAGSQTLRILFSYGNEPEPWGQWSYFGVPVAGQQDISAFTGIRFKARSNVTRPFRFAITSPAHSRGDEGIVVGFDMTLTSDVKTFSFELATATPPSWASDPGDDLNAILRSVTGFSFQPGCTGQDAGGKLPAGGRDEGWVDIDDLELF